MKSINPKTAKLISVLAVYFAANVIFILGPALQTISTELYPDIPYSTVLLISTLSSLFMIPGSLVAGAVIGKQINFKQMAILSMGGIIIAGVLPFFIRDIVFVLIMRAIVGFCIGLGFPLQSTLALKLFNDAERPKVLGWATFVMALGSITYMQLSGIVCDMNAAFPWLLHAIVIVPLILVLIFLKEPVEDTATATDTLQMANQNKKEKLPAMAVFTSAMFMIIFFAFYPVLLNMSAIVDVEGLGTAALAGTISSIFTIGNACAGLIFAPLYKKTGKYIIPVGLSFWAIGTAIFAFGHSIPMIAIGIFLAGIAIQIVWPGTINSFSEYVPKSKQSMASALFVSGMNIGCFCTTFFIVTVAIVTGNESPRLPCIIGLAIVVIFAAIWSTVEIKRKRSNAINTQPIAITEQD